MTTLKAIPGSELTVGMVWWPDTITRITVEAIESTGRVTKHGSELLKASGPTRWTDDGTSTPRFSGRFYRHDWLAIEDEVQS